MDPRERIGDTEEPVRQSLDSLQARMWTALPGFITAFDPVKMTCAVQATIQGVNIDKDGNATNVNLPKFVDCPVIFRNGGGFTLTFPVKASDDPTVADECLVIFSSRCIDAWWQQGGIQPPAEHRMHDLSDGFVLVGPKSQPRVVSNISTTATQLRSLDGTTFVEVGPSEITLQATTLNFKGQIVHTGDQTSSGTITGTTDVVAGTKALKAHTHTSEAVGTQTSPPT